MWPYAFCFTQLSWFSQLPNADEVNLCPSHLLWWGGSRSNKEVIWEVNLSICHHCCVKIPTLQYSGWNPSCSSGVIPGKKTHSVTAASYPQSALPGAPKQSWSSLPRTLLYGFSITFNCLLWGACISQGELVPGLKHLTTTGLHF